MKIFETLKDNNFASVPAIRHHVQGAK